MTTERWREEEKVQLPAGIKPMTLQVFASEAYTLPLCCKRCLKLSALAVLPSGYIVLMPVGLNERSLKNIEYTDYGNCTLVSWNQF